MNQSRDSLKDLLHGAKPKPKAEDLPPEQEEESEELSIPQMNGKYSTLRPANKTLTRVHVILKDGKVRSYQYVFLDALSTYDGNSFTLLFAGVKHWSVTVKGHGPNLWRVYDLCTLHRLPYLREASGSMPGLGDDGETVLTEIKIADVTPRGEE
jgi:hypothetical protein